MRRNVFNRILNAGNLVGFLVRNLNGEFILNGHDNLHNVETIQTQVLAKDGIRRNLGRVDLIKVLDDTYDAVRDFGRIQKGLSKIQSNITT